MGISVPREQVRERLLRAGFTFKRSADRVEIYRQKGTIRRVALPRRDLIPEVSVRIILSQAGLSPADIDDFLKHAVK